MDKLDMLRWRLHRRTVKGNAAMLALFQRSRYAQNDSQPDDLSSQNRRELFAVAAVAFVLQHSAPFKRYFLRAICAIQSPGDLEEFAIELQPHHHTDLLISHRLRSALYVVEFKVGAPLASKQNPVNPSFRKRPSGYGYQISHEPTYAAFRSKNYVVLQELTTFAKKAKNGLVCWARSWSDSVHDSLRNVTLVEDLLNTIGDLNVASLKFRHRKAMKKAKSTKDSVDMHQLLRSLLSDLGAARLSHNIGQDDEDSWYGLSVPTGAKGFNRFLKFHKKGWPLGWFGYQQHVGKPPELTVWIYSHSTGAGDRLEHMIQKRLPRAGKLKLYRDGPHVFLSQTAPSISDDRQWFLDTFDLLKVGLSGLSFASRSLAFRSDRLSLVPGLLLVRSGEARFEEHDHLHHSTGHVQSRLRHLSPHRP